MDEAEDEALHPWESLEESTVYPGRSCLVVHVELTDDQRRAIAAGGNVSVVVDGVDAPCMIRLIPHFEPAGVPLLVPSAHAHSGVC